MSDTTPPRELSPEGDADHDSASVDSGPIDVHELLESTRKLFAVENLPTGHSMDSAAPESDTHPPAVDSGEVADDAAPDESERGGQDDEPGDDSGISARQGFNVLAVVSVVLALLASPVAVIFGYISLGQARRANQRGETLALWGIGLGWTVLAAWVVGAGSIWWIAAQEGISLDSLGELIEFLSIP